MVGLINQTDPDQNYLKNGEFIFKERLKLNENNYEYLYKIAISQILQKKSKDASITLDKLINFDDNNANLYLAKSIVEIYNFKPKKANLAIIRSKNLNKNDNLISTINTVNLVSEIFNFKLKSIFQKIFI